MMFNQLVLVALLGVTGAFYLPGVVPRDYSEGEDVAVKVNKLDSVMTQLPYDYYSLPFCQPATITQSAENLGEVLAGDKIESSAYEIQMKIMQHCRILCRKTYSKAEAALMAKRIHQKYTVNLIVDNIPAAETYYEVPVDAAGNTKENSFTEQNLHYKKGFPLGFIGTEKSSGTVGSAYIFNHVRFNVLYHEDPEAYEGARIVGFQVQPYSIDHKYKSFEGDVTTLETCNALTPVQDSKSPQAVEGTEAGDILFTYDVKWTYSPIKWASRWDMYLKMSGGNIHWLAIANSFIVVIAVTCVVAGALVRVLRKDLSKYNTLVQDLGKEIAEEDAELETGWKLVHGDVFRPPANSEWLAVLVGTGSQLIAMCFVTLLFACFGFLSPANRGGLGTALLVVFVFMGIVAGYVDSRMLKMFGLETWKKNTVRIVLFFPGVTFLIFFIINLMVWSQHSTGAVPFGTLVALLVLWFGISAPLVYMGSYLGARMEATPFPKRVNNIPRLIPESTEWIQGNGPIVLGGLLPFSAISSELFFLLQSVWNHQFYYLFGILGLLFLILMLVCAELSIIISFQRICKEDYHWWWVSFLSSASTALYMFLASAYYYVTRMEIVSFVSGLVFFSYTFLMCFAIFIMCGTVGLFGAHYFMRKIYSSLRTD